MNRTDDESGTTRRHQGQLKKEHNNADLELATTEDLVNELLKRRIRFAFVALEDTNTRRSTLVCFSGKSVDPQDMFDLFELGREVFESGNDENDTLRNRYD